MKRQIIIYSSVVIFFLAAAACAKLYAKYAREQLKKTQKESVATEQNGDRRERIKICEVFTQPLTDTMEQLGSVEAYEDVELAARTGGTIKWIGPREGDRLQKGEKVAELDSENQLAEVARAKTSYNLAKFEFDRIQTTLEKGVASQSEFDATQAALNSSKALLDLATVALEYCTVASPIDGYLDRLPVDAGEHIEMGRTMMRIVDIDRVEVMVDVPEKSVLYFERGQKAVIEFSNGAERQFEGVIDFVALAADANSLTYPLKILVENPDHFLRPGMIVRVKLVRRELADAIAVPFFTIIDREDGKAVFVVENGVALERPIKHGAFQGGLVEIRDGLEIGDQVVVVGHRSLVNGEPVEIAQDVTELAKAFLKAGGDLSQMAQELTQ